MVPTGSWTSSSMAGRRSSHFFKIILPSSMADKKLRIPEKFVQEFGDELSTVATLTIPSGRMWQVGLEKANKKMWFHEGWQDFIEYYSIDDGYFLVFGYEGNSNFHILVFDKTATEIRYPSSKSCKLEDQVLDDAEKLGHDKLSIKGMCNSHELATKPEDKDMIGRKRFSGTSSKGRLLMTRGRDRAVQAARMFKPKHASFMRILRPHNISNYQMYVPVRFAVRYLTQNQIVKLRTSNGKQWDVSCRFRDHSTSAMKLGQGWYIFVRDNNLEEGDVCVFELIKGTPVILLEVSIFRVINYVSS
ncbi:B3 domain-containing transcription factor VRN1 [Morella rubra]|uniref:B3 domain-containing transcription factor VRN1 n=1 Tax=Morella rubra TaxID=262757 RepID=A0A6A1V0C5_9ROSI|nr:B3 domain-containing transcription factor VRN1 [Morella rubra]KAB1205488.1 B3 domain-containing transcription factor VRN1 [Morella rubra]KAB1207418.1 B3 domain-containing transcription factor VRN1 [Morella rubra]